MNHGPDVTDYKCVEADVDDDHFSLVITKSLLEWVEQDLYKNTNQYLYHFLHLCHPNEANYDFVNTP